MKKSLKNYKKIKGWNARLKELILQKESVTTFAEKVDMKPQALYAYLPTKEELRNDGSENWIDIEHLGHLPTI